ncbi:MAG: hypothetical protein ACPGQS_09415 [Bradymonadia bacterium]
MTPFLIFIAACGGVAKQSTSTSVSAEPNMVKVVRHLGSTVHLQLWTSKDELKKTGSPDAAICASSPLPIQLRIRSEALGIAVSGFEHEVSQTIDALAKQPGCLKTWVNAGSGAASLISRLAETLSNDQFQLAAIVGTAQSIENLTPAIRKITRSDQLPQHKASTSSARAQSRLQTFQSSGPGTIKIKVPLQLEDPETLATFELITEALRLALSNKEHAQVHLTPSSTPHEFFLEVSRVARTENVKEVLLKLIDEVCIREEWRSPSHFLAARASLEAAYIHEGDEVDAHAERLSRTTLFYGSQAQSRWYDQLSRMSYHDWNDAIETHLQPNSLLVEVGLSKDVVGTPNFEMAFFEEALAEQLREINNGASPIVASPRADILLFHQRPHRHQSLRLVIGLPSELRDRLTPTIKQVVADCIEANSLHDLSVDFQQGTLNLQAQFPVKQLKSVLDNWSDILKQNCSATNLTVPLTANTAPRAATHGLETLLNEGIHTQSTGTHIVVGQNSSSARRWWQSLLAHMPPFQFFAAGPLDANAIAPHLNRWSPYTPRLSWSNLHALSTNLAHKLTEGEIITTPDKAYVPLLNLSPRRRIILDAVCLYLVQQKAPAQCSVERSPYLIGVDTLSFENSHPEKPGKMLVRLKRFLLKNTPDSTALATALRGAVLKNEAEINAASTSVLWMQQRLWEPGRDWLTKSLWNGLFPEHTATIELREALKTLGDETL